VVADGHATPPIVSTCSPAGSWSFCVDHPAPSQRSASTSIDDWKNDGGVPVIDVLVTTIVQAFAAEQETAGKSFGGTSCGCGKGRGRGAQLVPFQLAAALSPEASFPATKHASGEPHETPIQKAPPALGWTVHAAPFQLSVSAGAPGTVPTATQAVVDVHDTALSAPAPGVCMPVHVAPFHDSATGPAG
jgi:hypothetical protein